MLTTGVDARNVRNIVLARNINSMVEFKQIVGRGTRIFEGKDYFTIIDYTGATNNSSMKSGMEHLKAKKYTQTGEGTPPNPPPSILLIPMLRRRKR